MLNMGEETPPETLPWYVRFREPTGQWRKLKMSVSQIIHRFRQGLFPAEIEVSPHVNGDFRPLLAFSEFQDLTSDMVRTKTPEESAKPFFEEELPASSDKLRWLVGAAVGIGILLVVALTLLVVLTR